MSKCKKIILYKYNRYTKEFTNRVIAQPNPEVPNDILIAAFSTTRKPPPVKAGYAIIFNESTNRWRYVVDKRGTIYWLPTDSEHSHVWDKLGPLPKNILLTAQISDLSKNEKYIAYDHPDGLIYVPCTDVYRRYFDELWRKYLLEHPLSFVLFIHKDNKVIPIEMDRHHFITIYKIIVNRSLEQLTKQIESENGLLK